MSLEIETINCNTAEEFLSKLEEFNSEEFLFRGQSFWGKAQPSIFYKEMNLSPEFSEHIDKGFLLMRSMFLNALIECSNNQKISNYASISNLTNWLKSRKNNDFTLSPAILDNLIKDWQEGERKVYDCMRVIVNLSIFFRYHDSYHETYSCKLKEFESLRRFLYDNHKALVICHAHPYYQELIDWLCENKFFTEDFSELNLIKINEFIQELFEVNILKLKLIDKDSIDYRFLYYLFELARHHEAPLAVLDISEDYKVASFFATEGDIGEKIKVYVIHEKMINRGRALACDISINVNLIKRDERYLSERAKAQKACFLWFDGCYSNEYEELPSLDNTYVDVFRQMKLSKWLTQEEKNMLHPLYIFTLPKNEVEKIKVILNIQDINKETLYCLPDSQKIVANKILTRETIK